MLYQGIIGGGSSPVEPVDLSPVLLWTNPSPASNFAAQTVSLDLTEYAGVIIEYNLSTEDLFPISRIYVQKNDNFYQKPPYYFGCGSGAERAISRGVSQINDEGIAFLDEITGLSDHNNNLLIPSKIYGVKKYVVEPNYGKHNIEWTAANSPYELETDKPIQMIYFKNKTSEAEYIFAFLNDDGTYISYSTGYTFTKITDTKIKIGYSNSSENFTPGTYQVYYII